MHRRSGDSSSSLQTHGRLLSVAAEVFAENGFRRATVRQISQRAGANIAAVNYHFGDKAGLYAAVLGNGLSASLREHPPDGGLDNHAPPEARLRVFIHSFLRRLFISSAGPHARLMAREMSEPTAALEVVVRQHIRPLADRLHGIVREILGSSVPPEQVRQCTMSIVGQCVFYRHAEQVVAKLFPAQKHTPAALERLAAQITAFSLAGLREIREQASRRAAPETNR